MCQNVVSELRLALMYLAAVCRACEIRVGAFIVNLFHEGRKTMNYQVFKRILLTVSALAMVTAGMCGTAYAQETCTCDEATFEILLDTYPESDCGEASMCRSMLEDIYKKTSVTDGETLDATEWGCIMKAFCGSIEAPVALSPSDMGAVSMWGFVASWSDVEDATGYHLDVSEKNDFSSFLAGYQNKLVAGTSYNVTGLVPGKTYFFRVAAEKKRRTKSEYSNIVKVTLPLTSKPAVKPTTTFDSFGFQSEWDEFLGAGGYLLDVLVKENDFSLFLEDYHDKAVSQLSHNVNKGIVSGETYFWRIRAYRNDPADPDNLQVSDYSDIVKVILHAPTETVSMWGFIASWDEVKDASGYHLDVSEKNDFSSFLTGYQNKSVEGTSQNVCHDNPGKTYYYRVRAYKADGTESDNSNTVTVDLPLTRKPSVIKTSYDPFSFSFRVEWYEFACADGYLLDVSTESDFSTFFDEYNSKAVTGLAHEVNDTAPGVSYYWRIRAYKGDPADPDSLEVSDYSDIVKLTLSAPPEPEPRPPLGCYLSGNIVEEKAPAGTVVGTFTASSPNRKATHTFELKYGTEYFAISGDTLKIAKEIPYDPVGYYIGVTTTNNDGLSRYDAFFIDILWAKEIYKAEYERGSGYKRTYFYYLSKKDGQHIKHGKDTLQGPEGLISEYNYEDGLRHGTCTDYSDGKKTLEQNYDKSELHGAYKKWDSEGSLVIEGSYTQGKKTGLWTYYKGYYTSLWQMYQSWVATDWAEASKLKETYDNKGKILSTNLERRDGSSYKASYSYEQGKVIKKVNDYWPGGQLEARYTREYLADDAYHVSLSSHLEGTYESWDEDGELQAQYEYSKGRRNGPYFSIGITNVYHGEKTSWWRLWWNKFDNKEEKGIYVNGLLDGAWTGSVKGAEFEISVSGNFKHGKEDGIWTEEHKRSGGGWSKIVSTYKNGAQHGHYEDSYSSTCCNVSYTDYKRGNIRTVFNVRGYYIQECGTWTGNYCDYDEDGVCFVKPWSYDLGACPDSEDDPPSGFVSGRVTDGAKDLPLQDVYVSLGSESCNTGSDGYYQFENMGKGDYTLRFSKSGFNEESESVTLTNSSTKTINKKLQALSEKPIVKGVKVGGHEAKDIKFLAVDADVEISADIEWDKGSRKNVTFNLNGKDFTGNKFNLLKDFTASNNANSNKLTVTAENTAGQKSEPFVIYPMVMPVPEWIKDLGELSFGGETYTVSIKWPEEPVEIIVSKKTLGDMWSAWGLVPFVGGREFGIPESQAGFELSYNPLTSEGEILLKGSSGFMAAGGKIIGTVGGGGEFEYKPGQGLVWNQGFLILGIDGEISKTVGPITLFPPLENAVNWPFVGGAIKWFNDKATITGTVGANANIKVGMISKDEGMGFNKADGDVGNRIGLAMAIDLYAVNAELAGEASTSVYWQFPASPDYLQKFEAKLVPSVTFSKWGASTTLSEEYTYTYPSSDGRMKSRTIKGLEPMKAVPRDFLNHGQYSRFAGSEAGSAVARRSRWARQSEEEETEEEEPGNEYRIIENVYPYAEPSLAENQGNAAIAFVYFDPTRRDLQATDIYISYFNGAEYSVPVPAQKDSRAEYSPNIAFDRNGDIVAVWERIKNENLTADGDLEDVMSAMTKEMEIVYAVYSPNSGIWTPPVALTDNAYIDHKPVLKTGRNGELMLFWISNQGNEMMSSAQKPDKINYSVWTGAGFEKIGTVPQDFGACLKYSYAYDGRNIFIAYIKDTDGDFGTSEDEDIFYVNFDGEKWNTPVQLTQDAECDDNPQLVLTQTGYPELIWLKGTTLARLTDWTQKGIYQIVRCGSESVTFSDFRLFKDPEDRLVVLWQSLNDTADPDLFYSVYDPESDLWSKELQLTRDDKMEKAFKGAFSDDGTLHLVFNRQNLTTGANDLYHITYRFSYDLEIVSDSLQAVSDTEEAPAPGKSANLICKVKNSGDLPVSADVSFYLGDPENGGSLIGKAAVEPSELRGGEQGEAKLAWTVPSDTADYAVYAVADPDNTLYEKDEFNNKVAFNAVKPDLEAIQCKIDRHGDGMTDIIAVFRNKGTVSAKNVKISYIIADQELNIVTVPESEPGTESQAVFSVFANTAFAGTDTKIQILLDSDSSIDESDESNNRASAYTGNPVSPLRCEFGGVNPDKGETQTLTFSDTGTGIDIKSLTVAGDGAADFEVKNDKCSGKNPADTCTADVVFTPSDTGSKSATLTVAFNTPGKDALEIPLTGTGLKPGDMDGDGQPTLADAIRVLKILTESSESGTLPGDEPLMMLPELLFYDYSDADVNGDGKLGIENAVYILNAVAETK